MTSQNKLRHEKTTGNWCDVLIIVAFRITRFSIDCQVKPETKQFQSLHKCIISS